jgi:hypothetical protein
MQISTLKHTTRFWNNIHQVRSKSIRLESQKVFGSNERKGHKKLFRYNYIGLNNNMVTVLIVV